MDAIHSLVHITIHIYIKELMAYTVTPTFNQVTGEQGDTEVSTSLHHSPQFKEDSFIQDEAFEPFEAHTPILDSLSGDKAQKFADSLLQSGKQLTSSEVSFIQQQVFNAPNSDDEQRLARLLDARVTGSTEALMPDDFSHLGIEMPNPDAPKPEQIDQIILSSEAKPDSAVASLVLNSDIGQDNAAVVVKHLAYQVFDGQMSSQQAYAKAYSSGVPHNELYAAFSRLQEVIG
ncbi:hypothetical protein [Synechococcus sp. UW105]|uniref:hypothetical protein n=1 Tax=Synechococcus sp. UW105 TaxID=337067 RepID=UPI0010BE0659|nr:hypothetical protein [Synechococcus sp. UW105]